LCLGIFFLFSLPDIFFMLADRQAEKIIMMESIYEEEKLAYESQAANKLKFGHLLCLLCYMMIKENML